MLLFSEVVCNYDNSFRLIVAHRSIYLHPSWIVQPSAMNTCLHYQNHTTEAEGGGWTRVSKKAWRRRRFSSRRSRFAGKRHVGESCCFLVFSRLILLATTFKSSESISGSSVLVTPNNQDNSSDEIEWFLVYKIHCLESCPTQFVCFVQQSIPLFTLSPA